MKSVFLISRTGCLLPFLITFNLFFGWLFLKPAIWLAVEAILILLFLLNLMFLTRGDSSFASGDRKGDVIDTEGEVLEEKHKIEGK